MTPVSIFNDVIGPVMRGPSSSHCAAALRIGRLARELMDGDITDVLVEFDRSGSLPTTHESQGSDMGLFGGLLGWDADVERLPDSARALAEAGIALRIETVDVGDPHPNTYRLTLRNHREQHSLIAISTGGGMMEVIALDGVPLSMDGGYHETLVWLPKDRGTGFQPVEASCESDRLEACPTMNDADEVLRHELDDSVLWQIKAAHFVSGTALAAGFRDRPVASAMPHTESGASLVSRNALASGLERQSALEPDASAFRMMGRCTNPIAVKRLAPVLPVPSRKNIKLPFTSCSDMLTHDGDKQTPLWQLAVEYERARGNFSQAEVLAKMTEIVRILRKSIQSGLAGTQYDDRVLGHQSGRFQELLKRGGLLDGGALNRIVLYVTAMMEVKSSMGVIVAAPTAGACAALPGAVIAMAESMSREETEMAKAMLAAGLIGAFIATRWTFAAEVGGCQAEGGSAASMAAAALVTLAGGTRDQAVAAASMAFQSMLGLICDPIANRVEAPCLGKNVMAAANALCCANMALAGFDPLIPLDEVIDAARGVAERMPREHRCTSLGGLAVTPTSLAIEKRLATLKGQSCAGCACN